MPPFILTLLGVCCCCCWRFALVAGAAAVVEPPPRALLDRRRLFVEAGSHRIDVVVGYRNDQGRIRVESTSGGATTKQGPGLKRVNAIRASVTEEELDELLIDTDIEYVEEDVKVRMLGQAESYGVAAIGGGPASLETSSSSSSSIPRPNSSGSCDDDGTIKVAVVDSGVDTSHPDISCKADNCEGQTFVGLPWDEPDDSHGAPH